jgi:hypothetical protein
MPVIIRTSLAYSMLCNVSSAGHYSAPSYILIARSSTAATATDEKRVDGTLLLQMFAVGINNDKDTTLDRYAQNPVMIPKADREVVRLIPVEHCERRMEARAMPGSAKQDVRFR